MKKLLKRIYNIFLAIEGFLFPKIRSLKLFKKMNGCKCNLKNPQTLNEKLMYYKFNLYWDNEIVNKCADKYEVTNFVKQRGLSEILFPFLGCWDKFDDINFDELPNQFVLKLSNGSGRNIFCNDKSKFDIEDARKKFKKWMKEKYGLVTAEQGIYRNVKKRIIAEPFIPSDTSMPPRDFKFFCSYGEVKLLFVASDRKEGKTKFDYYLPSWEWIPVKNVHPNAGPIEKPKNYEKMVDFASKLSRDFPLVRIDFYNNNGNIIFGEITFTHMGCVHPFDPKEYDLKFGQIFPSVKEASVIK